LQPVKSQYIGAGDRFHGGNWGGVDSRSGKVRPRNTSRGWKQLLRFLAVMKTRFEPSCIYN
jgi:hypothetical protein